LITIRYHEFLDLNIKPKYLQMVKVFKDIFTGHELVSDSYDIEEKYDGHALFVKSNIVTEDAIDIGIEAEDGQLEEGATRVNNIAHFFNYNQSEYTKKEYLTLVKGYMKSIIAKLEEENPEKVDSFKTNAQQLVKFIVENFKECDL